MYSLIKNCFIASLMVFTFTLLTSCGNEYFYELFKKEVKEETKQTLEGVWYLEEGGEIEILLDNYGRYQITTFDQITTINPENSTYAVHPTINRSDVYPRTNGDVTFSIDVNYTSGNDVEADTTGNNITGKKRTDLTFSVKDDILTLVIEIFSDEKKDNPNTILATRTLKGER